MKIIDRMKIRMNETVSQIEPFVKPKGEENRSCAEISRIRFLMIMRLPLREKGRALIF